MNDTRKRRPTLQDIADLTGVTKMTVSRYLRDPQAVAEGTRERIAAAVEELGYIPNRAPDILSNATSKAIGILIPSLHPGLLCCGAWHRVGDPARRLPDPAGSLRLQP